jgi:hypothetical protein
VAEVKNYCQFEGKIASNGIVDILCPARLD